MDVRHVVGVERAVPERDGPADTAGELGAAARLGLAAKVRPVVVRCLEGDREVLGVVALGGHDVDGDDGPDAAVRVGERGTPGLAGSDVGEQSGEGQDDQAPHEDGTPGSLVHRPRCVHEQADEHHAQLRTRHDRNDDAQSPNGPPAPHRGLDRE